MVSPQVRTQNSLEKKQNEGTTIEIPKKWSNINELWYPLPPSVHSTMDPPSVFCFRSQCSSDLENYCLILFNTLFLWISLEDKSG